MTKYACFHQVDPLLDGHGRVNEHLISRSQLGPRLVCSAIIVMGICDLHILVEP